MIGFTSGVIPQVKVNRLLLHGCEVVGVYWGLQKEHDLLGFRLGMQHLLDLVGQGRMAGPEPHAVGFSDVVGVLEALRNRTASGKFVVLTDDSHS
ncbi:hypothetical protein E3O45_01985 [Cryobacterium sp. TMS1-20-1]|uniref:hypothetical protein n=1 Tax=Cryobacterium sp. TMS1-20-1 TaxID=1259223 RepID=UPI00106ADB6E|nr:hypothetical protein [Cryobacterium sp. TMS1-20-1]TFC80525.1 hypothetical protein E3O45_01985 [Cryobacterium sp. TMS1-20-1]